MDFQSLNPSGEVKQVELSKLAPIIYMIKYGCS